MKTMKIKQILTLYLMKLKKVPNPLINAQKYRFKGMNIGENIYIYSQVFGIKQRNQRLQLVKLCLDRLFFVGS